MQGWTVESSLVVDFPYMMVDIFWWRDTISLLVYKCLVSVAIIN